MLCGILSGPGFEKSWQDEAEPIDFYTAKGVVKTLLSQLGVEASLEHCQDETLHPGKQASIVVADGSLGVVGELHPKVAQAFEISEPVYLFEINLTALLPYTVGHRMFQPIPRFPAIVRDIALVVDAGITHQKVLNIINSSPLVSQVTLFDVYTGEPVPPGKKSLAYRITFQSPARTLTDKAVDNVQQQILAKLSHDLGATLRTQN